MAAGVSNDGGRQALNGGRSVNMRASAWQLGALRVGAGKQITISSNHDKERKGKQWRNGVSHGWRHPGGMA